jgi:hypothetical protein
VGSFPAPIASAIQAWEVETDAFRRLARLLACFESLIQYAAIVAVSEFHRAALDREFPDVDALIRDVIPRPSIGTWQRIYREAAGAFRNRRSALVCDALYRFGLDDTGRSRPTMHTADKLIRLRNEQKGHGGVLANEGEYLAILDEHETYLRDLLDAAEFARDLTLCVVLERSPRGVVMGRLMGPVESAEPRDEFPPADDAPPPGHVAARHDASGRWIDLSPLLLYLDCERAVERIDGHGHRTRERCGRPGVFFHHELLPPSRVRGFEFRYAHHSSWRFPDFDFVGAALERFGRRAGSAAEAEWYTTRIDEATRLFVGRLQILERLSELATRGPRRVAFVRGSPGVGKSTLLARWVAAMEPEGSPRRVHVFRHFIQEQYPESARASTVFDVLRLQVCARFGLDPTPPYPDGRSRATRYRAALLDRLTQAAPLAGTTPVALVIDGLDEALRVVTDEDEDLLPALPGPDLLPRGVCLILSGRPSVEEETLFSVRFGPSVAERLELSQLSDAEVHQWFNLAFEPDFTLRHREFLERVATAARGLPQYLHFVLRALKDGTLQPGDARTLPEGLEDFYRRVMREAAEGSPAALRVIALLASAAAPMDLATIAAVLAASMEEAADACDAARNVLHWDGDGRVLLFHAEFAEWVRAGEGHSAEDARRRETWTAISSQLVDWCRDWASHRHPYAATNLVTHLLALERHEEILALARNTDFLRFQTSARPEAPDLPLATFRAALHRASDTGRLAEVAELGLRRVTWATSTLAESPLDVLRQGAVGRARRLVDLHGPVERLTWYCILARAIMDRDGAPAAEEFLGLPARLPWWSDREKGDLRTVADAILPLHPLPGFASIWRLYLPGECRSRLARGLAVLGRLEQAEEVIRATPSSIHRDHALIRLAGRYVRKGDFARAEGLVKETWLTRSRRIVRELVWVAEAPARGITVLDTVERESGPDVRARDDLFMRIATAFARNGMFAEGEVAARRIAKAATREVAFSAIARLAIDGGELGIATRLIGDIDPGGTTRRSLLDRAGLRAIRGFRIADAAKVVRADPIARPLLVALGVLAGLVATAAAILLAAGPSAARHAGWGPVAWLVGAVAVVTGLRTRSGRAGLAAALWGGLTGFGMQLASDAGPRGAGVGLVTAGLALLLCASALGIDRLRHSVMARAATSLVTAMVTAAALTVLAGPRLRELAGAPGPLAFAALFPSGAAVAVAAFARVTTPTERLVTWLGALVPAIALAAAGNLTASGLMMPSLVGLAVAGIASVVRVLPAILQIPKQALFLAIAELVRATLVHTDTASILKGGDVLATVFFLGLVLLMVTLLQRQEKKSDPVEQTAEAPAVRLRPSLTDLQQNPVARAARFRAELLLRLARLFPRSRSGRSAVREATSAAAAMATRAEARDHVEEPVRADLLWQAARESWRQRDLPGAVRAAWLVEWRRTSGYLAAAVAMGLGALYSVAWASWVARALPQDETGLALIGLAVGAVLSIIPGSLWLRSLREPLSVVPLTLAAGGWLLADPGDPVRYLPVLGLMLVFLALATGGPGRIPGGIRALLRLLRWQALALPVGYLAVAGVAWRGGLDTESAKDLLGNATSGILLVLFLTFAATALLKGTRRILPGRAKDLPDLAEESLPDLSVFERGTFSDDVGAAVLRLAEREPGLLPDIARAAAEVR